jgi:FtsH-binding integral membrane protein
VVVASIFMGFTLGIVWAYLMVVLACGFIVYDTSNVIHHHRTDEHVAASLELFASVALMFWYVLRIFMLSGRND